jgi:hypothetical protein
MNAAFMLPELDAVEPCGLGGASRGRGVQVSHTSTTSTTSTVFVGQLMLITTIGLLPEPAGRLLDAMKPGIHCVGTHWIRVSLRSNSSSAPGSSG